MLHSQKTSRAFKSQTTAHPHTRLPIAHGASSLVIMTRLQINIWSDIACPWCYVGKRRFEAAFEQFEHKDSVDVTWRSFELNPNAPPVERGSGTQAERLARKYGSSVSEAEQRLQMMTELGAKAGITFRFDRMASGNTFAAHRLLHFAKEHGRQNELKERLLQAYMSEGLVMSDPEVLGRLAGEVGLDAKDAKEVARGTRYTDEARADEEEAQAIGISGVPFFVIGRYGISGAQSTEVLLDALNKAWSETAPLVVSDGQSCGTDGCV